MAIMRKIQFVQTKPPAWAVFLYASTATAVLQYSSPICEDDGSEQRVHFFNGVSSPHDSKTVTNPRRAINFFIAQGYKFL